MPRPLEHVPWAQLLEELDSRTDCFMLAYIYRAAPFDESNEDERFRLFFTRSPTTAIGMAERAKHFILSGDAELIDTDEDDDEPDQPSPKG